jgi:succinate dehydrogenase / fumarate reductase cytochrome b subunit
MSTVATSRSFDGAFLRSRLGSFLAVFPLAIWTVNHLWQNLSAFQGPEAWQKDVTEYPHPVAFFATSVVVLLPLALHTVWGFGRLFQTKPNVVQYGFFANWKYLLQRLSGIGLFLFLGAHLWLAMLHPRLTTGRPEPFHDIAHEMRNHGPTTTVYALGVLGIAYHLANGLHTFCMGWGIVSSRAALKKLTALVWIFFVILLGLGYGAMYALWERG